MRTQALTACMAIGLVAGGELGAVVEERQDGGVDRSASSQQVQPGQQPSQQPGQRPGVDMGSIDDLIIDTQSGHIKSAVFKTGGVAGVGTRLASLEWPQVIFSAEGDAASINMNADTLSERGIKTDEFWERHTVEGIQAKSTATSNINR